MIKSDFVIRSLDEMGLNYSLQYPDQVPDIGLVCSIIVNELKKEVENG